MKTVLHSLLVFFSTLIAAAVVALGEPREAAAAPVLSFETLATVVGSALDER